MLRHVADDGEGDKERNGIDGVLEDYSPLVVAADARRAPLRDRGYALSARQQPAVSQASARLLVNQVQTPARRSTTTC